MTAAPEWDIISDADLAVAAAAGDRAAFAGIYDRYADRLHDFCIGMLRDRDAAADCVQDTFCTAATRLPQLRDPNRLRPWLYAIARNEALRRIKERRREQPSEDLPDEASGEAGPDVMAARTELADLMAEAAGGLSERDRAVLELAYRHGLDGPELAEAMDVSAAHARTLLHRLHETVERSLGALLVARRVRTGQGCNELRAMLADWDGRFTVLIRKRIARHMDSCLDCEQDRRRLVSPVALLGGTPVLIPAPRWLRGRVLTHLPPIPPKNVITDPFAGGSPAGSAGAEHTRRPASSAAASGALIPHDGTKAGPVGPPPPVEHILNPDDQHGTPPPVDHHANGHQLPIGVLLLLGVLAVIAVLTVGIAWLQPRDVPTTPAGTSESGSASAPPASSASTESPPSSLAPIIAASTMSAASGQPPVQPVTPPTFPDYVPSRSVVSSSSPPSPTTTAGSTTLPVTTASPSFSPVLPAAPSPSLHSAHKSNPSHSAPVRHSS